MGLAAGALAAVAALAPAAFGYSELTLTVSGAPARFIAGDSATLVAKITNVDPLMRTGSKLQLNARPLGPDPEILPTLSGIDCAPFVGPAVTCQLLGDLPFGASREHTLTVTSKVLGELILEMGASAQVGEDFPVVLLAAPQLQWKANVEPKADIKLDFSAGAETVANGANVTLRALVTNKTVGGVAYGTVVKFSIPPELQVVDRPQDCTGTQINLTCPVGDLDPELTAQRLVTVRSTQEGSFTVNAGIAWARPDATPVDNQADARFSVLAPFELPGGAEPTPAPKPATSPATLKPKAVSLGTLVDGVPGTRRCIRTRRLNVVLRAIKNLDPVRATIRVTGRKRALVLKGSRAQRPFVLKLPRRGKAVVRLAVTLENGRRYTATRTYRRC